MKINDRVCYTGGDEQLLNKEGVLVFTARGYAKIVFDEPVPGGTDFNGQCEAGHGLYVPLFFICKVRKYKAGEEVRLIHESYYGTKVKIENGSGVSQDDDKYSVIDASGEVMVFSEENLVSEEEFVPSEFVIGECVDLNPEMRQSYYRNSELREIIQSYGVKNFVIKGISRREDGFYYKFSRNGNSIIVPESRVIHHSVDDGVYTKWETALQCFDTSQCHGVEKGTLVFPREIYTYSSFLCALDSLDDKSFDELRNGQCIMSFQDISRTLLVAGGVRSINNYLNKDFTFFCNLDDDTFDVFVDLANGIGNVTHVSEDKTWFIVNDAIVIFYDPFCMDIVLKTLLDVFEYKNSKNFIYELLQQEKYEVAVQKYAEYAKQYNEVLAKKKKEKELSMALEKLSAFYLDQLRLQENDLKRQTQSHEEDLRNLYQQLRKIQIQILGTINSLKNDECENLSAFLNGMGEKLLELRVRDNGDIRLHVIQELMFFDSDMYHASNVRKGYEEDYGEAIGQLLDDIMDRKITLIMEEEVALIYGENRVKCMEYGSSNSRENKKFGIPNPHHFCYNCWGDNTSLIAQAFASGQYVAAISQVIAAIGSINIADGAVFHEFVSLLDKLSVCEADHWNSIKCIVDNATKKQYTVCEYVEKIEGK